MCKGSSRFVVANVLDCDIVVSEFKLELRYYVHFRTNIPGKGMNPFISTSYKLTVSQLFYKDCFGIE